MTSCGMFIGRRFSDSEQPSTPPASVDADGRGRRKRTEHSEYLGMEITVLKRPILVGIAPIGHNASILAVYHVTFVQ